MSVSASHRNASWAVPPPHNHRAWVVASACALLLHAGAALWLSLRPAAVLTGEAQPAVVLVNMAPQPESAPPIATPAPAANESAPSSAKQQQADSVVQPQVVEALPAPIVVPRDAIVLPPKIQAFVKPQPRPIIKKRIAVVDDDDDDEPFAKPKLARRVATDANARSAESASRAQANAAARDTIRASNAAAAANYGGAVMAHLQRYKRYPDDARERGESGVARLAFTLDRSGNVVASRLAGSSGSGAIDREVAALARRASPFPPPPPGASLSFVVPVRFGLR